jgi:hypothetical protein
MGQLTNTKIAIWQDAGASDASARKALARDIRGGG